MTNRFQFVLIMFFAMLSGCFGGMLIQERSMASGKFPSVIKAEKFQIVDKTGKILGEFSSKNTYWQNNEPFIAMYDKNDKTRFELEMGNGHPSFNLYDENKESSIIISEGAILISGDSFLGDKISSNIMFSTKLGKPVIYMNNDKYKNNLSLELNDGNPRFTSNNIPVDYIFLKNIPQK